MRAQTSGHLLAIPALIAALLSLGGCATLVEGDAQVIRIETDPPGASCSVLRAGQVVTNIPSTPASISLYKTRHALKLECTKTGFLPATFDENATFSGVIFGNILFGGLIGAAIDMGSGATHKYPDMIEVTLIPESFPSSAARDAFFASLTARIRDRERQAIARKREACSADNCSTEISQIRQSFAASLQALQQQRNQARVEGPGPT